jgi:hypothetical protein
MNAVDAGDEPRIASLAAAVSSLAAGWYWTRNEAYAERAAALVRTWFTDPATAMNPNLNFGQIMPFVAPNGSFSGLIEMDGNLLEILDGLALLAAEAPCAGPPPAPACAGSDAWGAADQTALLAWLSAWDAWLAASPFSAQALTFFNNHNGWARSMWTGVSAWVGNWTRAEGLLNGAKVGATAPIGGQIWADGELPAEEARVNSIGYVTMDLGGALFSLGMLSR